MGEYICIIGLSNLILYLSNLIHIMYLSSLCVSYAFRGFKGILSLRALSSGHSPTAQNQILPVIPDTYVATAERASRAVTPSLRFLLFPPIPARSASAWPGHLSAGNSFHWALRHGSIRVTSFVASLTSRNTFRPGHDPRQTVMSHLEPAALPGAWKRPSGPAGRAGRGPRARVPLSPTAPGAEGLRGGGAAAARTQRPRRDIPGEPRPAWAWEGPGRGGGRAGPGPAGAGELRWGPGWRDSSAWERSAWGGRSAPGTPGWGLRQGSVKRWKPANKTAPLPPAINNPRIRMALRNKSALATLI